eukprot:11159454-Lingulodinium_polyedra.AAC.1
MFADSPPICADSGDSGLAAEVCPDLQITQWAAGENVTTRDQEEWFQAQVAFSKGVKKVPRVTKKRKRALGSGKKA